MKKILFTAIIIFSIVSHVLGSEVFKRADGNQCINQGGQCKNPKSCSGTVISGLCPGDNDNKCCIPKPPTNQNKTNSQNKTNNSNKTNVVNKDKQCINQGGQCKNPKSCSGTVISGLCPGGNDNKCCIPKPPTNQNKTNSQKKTNNSNKTNVDNKDNQCTNQGGQCKNPKNCSGNVISGLCPGGNDNKCCIPGTILPTKGKSEKANTKASGKTCTLGNNIYGVCVNRTECVLKGK